jgi:hypothetical protein
MKETKDNCTFEPKTQTPNETRPPAPGEVGDLWGVVIFAYSRAQAIQDGVIIDISHLAREAGFRYPVAMTAGAWHACVRISPSDHVHDEVGRLWDVLNVLRFMISESPGGSELRFFVTVCDENEVCRQVRLRSVCQPGDNAEPVITIMLQDED